MKVLSSMASYVISYEEKANLLFLDLDTRFFLLFLAFLELIALLTHLTSPASIPRGDVCIKRSPNFSIALNGRQELGFSKSSQLLLRNISTEESIVKKKCSKSSSIRRLHWFEREQAWIERKRKAGLPWIKEVFVSQKRLAFTLQFGYISEEVFLDRFDPLGMSDEEGALRGMNKGRPPSERRIV